MRHSLTMLNSDGFHNRTRRCGVSYTLYEYDALGRVLHENWGNKIRVIAEASELRDSLDELLKKPLNNHAHITNENFQKEITVCIYDINNLTAVPAEKKHQES